MRELTLIEPILPPPGKVKVVVTTRSGGVSNPPYSELNLAAHVGDDEQRAFENRTILASHCSLPTEPVWLNQIHGDTIHVVKEERSKNKTITADASYSDQAGIVLAVLVADCLPILMCSSDGREIAALHAGWRGLAKGIVRCAVDRFQSEDLIAWLGPAIGPCHYEVDRMVRDHFKTTDAFLTGKDETHWQFDMFAEAERQLNDAGVSQVERSMHCTFCDENLYSFRREGTTGRFAALVWRED